MKCCEHRYECQARCLSWFHKILAVKAERHFMLKYAMLKCHILLVCLMMVSAGGKAQADDKLPCTDEMVTWQQYEDPKIIDFYSEVVWPEELQQPWLRALMVPESDLRREAADTISLAVRVGLKPLPELEKELLSLAIDPNQSPTTRLSATSAIIACDFRATAPSLKTALDSASFELRVMIETVLAAWKHQPMGPIWVQRLDDWSVDSQLYHCAVAGVAELQAADAVPALKKLALAPSQPLTRRLAAADAWARLSVASKQELDDLISSSQRLLDNAATEKSPELLLAVRLAPAVSPDSTEFATGTALLNKFADHPWNVIRGDGLAKLLGSKPEDVIARAEENIVFPDTNVRQVTVDSLVLDKSQRSVVLLGKALMDLAPKVRQSARDHLLTFAEDSQWTEAVLAEANGILTGDSWQGLEQAILIVTRLQHREARQRIAELAEHPRPEVFVTASWSLKTLAETDWAPQLFELLEKRLLIYDKTHENQDGYAAAHLMEAMGPLGYRKALPVLRKCFPKGAPYSIRARCAAIWAAGFLADENNRDELERTFVDRLMDFASIPPEDLEVRAMSAVALGRMKASGALDTLRDRAKTEGREGLAGSRAYWAISQITDEPMPDVPTIYRTIGGWSLQPAAPVSK